MAMIPLTNTFTICPEGVHTFKITQVEYDETFGKMKIELVTDEKIKVYERFSLMNQDGTYNDKACGAFSFFAKTALNILDRTDITEVDPNTLVGRYIKAEVVHSKVPSNNDPAKIMTFVNVGQKWVADIYLNEEVAPKTGLDLDALLNS